MIDDCFFISISIFSCKARNGGAIVKLIDEYLNKVLATNPGVITQIENESYQKIYDFDHAKRQML